MLKLKRDDIIILETKTDSKIYEYIHKNHSYSVSWAMKHEGYKVYEGEKDITNNFI